MEVMICLVLKRNAGSICRRVKDSVVEQVYEDDGMDVLVGRRGGNARFKHAF